uniref:Rho guanine nucleotide exchange factor (GEF) 1b n=1 Tax=Neogobius melanostomus TaxID=47308 RepID=A0A8C6WND4_9GOBI
MDLDDNESRGVFGAHSSNPAMSIIGAEDEFFESDLNDVGDDQCKYFGSIDQLKDHPAHLLTFIQHVILQFDPAPLLCYLHGALHKNLSAKETKKQFVEFHNNFLDKGAVLRVAVPLSISNELDRNRPELLPEETQKRFVHDVQSLQTGEVAKQLDDFRQKRMMGMTPCEAELMDVENHYPTDRIPMEMKEKSVAENILDKMAESTQSIFSAVALYMKHLGVKTRAVDSKKSRGGFFRIPIGKVHLPLSWEMYGSLTVLNSASSMVTNIISVLAIIFSLSPEGLVFAADGPGASPTSASPQLEEVEPRLLEFEQDPPNWRELAAPEAVSSLRKKEIKRQEVINELFATEHAHVRMLSVLQMIFAKPLERAALLTADELAAIFPNLDEIIDMHYNFYENLKKLRHEDGFIVKSISTTVLNRFGGTEGEWFQKLTARSCSHQSWALEQIKSRQKKDPRFNSFIQEAESKPQCRRLQLKDIIPTEMQRLTKYPLLLENIAKNTEDFKEKERIQQSAECCRKILNHVNEEVKSMENLLFLHNFHIYIHSSTFKVYGVHPIVGAPFSLSDLSPVLFLSPAEVQCVLLGDMLVLLQKLDDKMVLKCQSKSSIAVEGKMMLSPIIKLDSVFLREVATDQKAFYVIFTWESGAQIYELVAQTVGERKA